MPIRTSVFLPALVLALAPIAACGGGSGPSSNPDDLVASWREIPSTFRDPGEPTDLLEISDGDRFMLTEPDGTINIGEWSADDQDLTFTYHEDGQATDFRSHYVLDGSKLLTGALFPDGAVDGTVGTWRGDASIGSASFERTLTLTADGVAHYVDQSAGEDSDRTGTWSHDGADVVISFEEGGFTLNIHFQELPGIAIGGPLYERL